MLEIDYGAEGWLHRYAAKQHWKVAHFLYDVEDLIQDGYVAWYTCANRYSHVTDYGRMMSLFKITYANHITGLASTDKNPRSYEHVVTRINDLIDPRYQAYAESWILDKVTGQSLLHDGTMSTMIAEAKEPVKTVLSFLVSDAGIRIMRRPIRKRLSGTRETTNSRIYRALRLKPQGDLMGMVKSYVLQCV